MLAHGGIYHTYQRSSTCFIIASNLPDVKIRQITNTSNSKILSPQWIVDCLKEERIIDYSNYLLYSNCTSNQRKMTDFQSELSGDDDSNDNKEFKEMIVDGNTESTVDISKELESLNKRMQDLDYTEINDCNYRSTETNTEKRDIKPSARSAVDSNFLTEFYNNSRLHHISTLGAKFKEYISELRENHDGKFPGRDELTAIKSNELSECEGKSSIMHIDMDCFFVSVGLRSRPQFRGFPVAVTHSKGTFSSFIVRLPGEINSFFILGGTISNANDKSLSEIASCSYEAREMGLKNGMFVGKALQLCPDLKTIPYDFDQYKEVAFTLYDTIAKYILKSI